MGEQPKREDESEEAHRARSRAGGIASAVARELKKLWEKYLEGRLNPDGDERTHAARFRDQTEGGPDGPSQYSGNDSLNEEGEGEHNKKKRREKRNAGKKAEQLFVLLFYLAFLSWFNNRGKK